MMNLDNLSWDILLANEAIKRMDNFSRCLPPEASVLGPQPWVDVNQKKVDEILEKITTEDMKKGAVKADANKPPTHLLSNIAAKRTARVMGFGAQKYAEHNWRKGMKWSRLLRAARDHISDFIDGEDLDPESGLCHLDHAACCIMFLQEYLTTYPELDDRYKRASSQNN